MTRKQKVEHYISKLYILYLNIPNKGIIKWVLLYNYDCHEIHKYDIPLFSLPSRVSLIPRVSESESISFSLTFKISLIKSSKTSNFSTLILSATCRHDMYIYIRAHRSMKSRYRYNKHTRNWANTRRQTLKIQTQQKYS